MPKPSSEKPGPSAAVLAEFKHLFNAARKEHAKAGGKATPDSPAHQAAVAYAVAQKIPGAELLLDCLIAALHEAHSEAALEKIPAAQAQLPATLYGHAVYVQGLLLDFLKHHDEAINCFQQVLDTPGFDTPGDVHHYMGNAYYAKGEHDHAITCYQQALDTPSYDSAGMAYNNMGNAYYAKGEYDRAITCYQQALDTPGYDTPGMAHNNMGNAYYAKGEHDRAITCYQQAIDTPGYQTPGMAHNNMGLAYRAKGEYDRAITCYQQAIDTPGYHRPGDAHNNMGNAYYAKSEYDRAITCYQQALDTPGYDTPGDAHNNMGYAYYAKGEYDRAITCYQQAIDTPGYHTPDMTRNNLALSLQAQGKFQEALTEVAKVLKEPDTGSQHERARDIKRLIEDAAVGVKPTLGEEALVKAESGKGSDSFEQLILKKLGRQEQGRKDKYDEYLEQPISSRDDVFSCLRGWSSAVTLLEGSTDSHWVGGGYFLKWRGKGIVIDPGFDFIDNFHDARYHMREVDAVLVSHNHSDHNYDLGSVDDLRYQLHTRWKTLPQKKKRKFDVSQCLFVMDEDTAKVFSQNRAEHRGSPIHFSAASHERQWWIKKANGLPVTVEHFPVWHGHELLGAVGMRLRLHGTKGQPDFIIGYTGDTEYFENLPEELKGCDVLLAHISQPEEEELLDSAEYEKKKKAGEIKNLTADGFKKKHLGYNGLIKLIQEAQPKLVLVGEFWAGLEDIRIDLIKGLSERTGKKIPILPTGLGFHLKLPSLEVECTGCHEPVHHGQIKIAPATSPFGPLGYLCPRCLG
jgi:tetratricopeptide (TPR) repeat protein/ribonuclease BN (tRNA processing enzyme)